MIFGDRGYLSETIQLDLFQSANIKLETPKRSNKIHYKPQPYFSNRQESNRQERELKVYFNNYAISF
jgi:hypothetical protein